MRKQELADKVAEITGMSKLDARKAIDATVQVTKESVANGESIFIRGFGTFETKIRKAKKARVISTGETIMVPERKVPTFKPCFSFKEEVQNGKVFPDNN